MIECRKCGAKYPTERLFCGKCKERLGIRCSVCGFINLLDDLFCGICLTELNIQTGISVGQESEESFASLKTGSVFSESLLYNQIQMSAQEDEAFFAEDGGKISQEDIDEIFQEEQE
jgi:hypothetical protein